MPNQPSLKPIPKPQKGDEIVLDGFHYFLSRQSNNWAILHDGDWKILHDRYQFIYMGEDKTHMGTSKWQLIRKPGTPKLEAAGIRDSLNGYSVTAKINKHIDTVHVRARDKRHANMLAYEELSKKIGLPVSTLRSMCLPDSFDINLET